MPQLLENVVKYKLSFEMRIYPGTFHAYFNHTGMSYNKEASEESWERMLHFYSQHLGE